MTSIDGFLGRLKELGVKLNLVDDNLKINAPKGALTPDLVKELKARKAELVLFLRQARAVAGSAAVPPLVRVDRSRPLPLSFAQQRLWVLDQLEGPSSTYNEFGACLLIGSLDLDLLTRCFKEIVRRHEILRTNYVTRDGDPVQYIHQDLPVEPIFLDVTHLCGEQREDAVHEAVDKATLTPFNLASDLLFRILLVKQDREEHRMVLVMHHITADHWAMGALMYEFIKLYEAFQAGKPSPLLEPRIQYADFAVWQRQWIQGAERDRLVSFWKNRLKDLPPLLELPTDKPRPAVQTFAGRHHHFDINSQVRDGLIRLSKSGDATLFMTLLAAYGILLQRYARRDDIAVGTVVANRNRAELEGLIGFFVNTVVMRLNLGGRLSFAQLLTQTRTVVMEALANQDLPFELVVEAVAPERNLGHTPLFQAMIVLQNAPAVDFQLPNLTQRTLKSEVNHSKFDLSLEMEEHATGIEGYFEYNTDLFTQASVSRMEHHFKNLLNAVLAHPTQPLHTLDLMDADERRRVLKTWNATQRPFAPNQSIVQLFEARAQAEGAAVAVQALVTPTTMTYAQLNARAEGIAQALRSRGIGPEQFVGVYLERGVEFISALLGILKSGGAFVTLDPAYPRDRIQYMLDNAGARLILTTRALQPQCPVFDGSLLLVDDLEPTASTLTAPRPHQSAAYLIYTSGSTGRPKGVCVPMDAMTNFVQSTMADHHFGPEDSLLQFASLNFDTAVEEIFPTLCSGGRLVLRNNDMLRDTPTFFEQCRALGLTILDLPTAFWGQLNYDMTHNRLTFPPKVRLVIIGGERVQPDHVRSWRAYLGSHPTLMNTYGPTETTVVATAANLSAPELETAMTREAPIGRPLGNVRVYIADTNLRAVPSGVPGELLIAGAGLARGYLNQPDLTAAVFCPDPFSTTAGARLYRSGDLARFLADGQIEYLGRVDHQIKIRGFRIELGEIEATLADHPDAVEVVVKVHDDEHGPRLIAFVQAGSHRWADRDQLQTELLDFIGRKLPHYMTPSYLSILETMPLTPTGKVDRAALTITTKDLADSASTQYVAPRSETETTLVDIFSEVLKHEKIGVEDNFFLLGGHSLLATKVMSMIRHRLETELPLQVIFEAPTPAQLAARVIQRLGSGHALKAPPIRPVPRGETMPLSFAQNRMWFLDQLAPGSPNYNIPAGLTLTGSLNREALEKALAHVIHRHESLRTTFTEDEHGPHQVIHPRAPGPVLTFLDLTASEDQDQQVQTHLRDHAAHAFNLKTGPLLNVLLLRLNPQRHVLLVNMHHIISDGWSIGVLVNEIGTVYQQVLTGRHPSLPPLPAQYADFAVWQRQWLQGEELERQLGFWRNLLTPPLPMLDLRPDFTRPPVQTFNGKAVSFRINRQTGEALKALAAQSNATLFMVLLTAFKTLLHRYTGQDDILVGTPIANRNRHELEPLIGFFVNTLALRTDLSGSPSFRRLLDQVRERTLQVYDHQDMPFERLVEELQPQRDQSRPPLFQVFFALQNNEESVLNPPGLTLARLEAEVQTAKFELTLNLYEEGPHLFGLLDYNTDLFKAATINGLVNHYQAVLNAAAQAPTTPIDRIKLLTPAERRLLLHEWTQTATPFPIHESVDQAVARLAAATPNQTALVDDHTTLTYAQLNRLADGLAQQLRHLGVRPNDRVVSCMPRSLNGVVGLLAILKTNAAYVPVDPALPRDRKAYIARESRAAAVLCLQAEALVFQALDLPVIAMDSGDFQAADPMPQPAFEPDRIAYIIYTSGSTGEPKGVPITHRGLLDLIHFFKTKLEVNPADRATLTAGPAFDAQVFELWPFLAVGAAVYIPNAETRLDSDRLAAWMLEHQITVSFIPTPMVPPLLTMAWPKETALRLLHTGGDKLSCYPPPGLPFKLLNNYGPTECTVMVTSETVPALTNAKVPPAIGGAVANARLYVVDRRLTPVPPGLPGQLLVGGVSLSPGYWQRPSLTASAFIPDPFSDQPGERLYQTGDLVRYREDGRLDFLGRIDHQVKIRGYRIELGEIEGLLETHPHAAHALVVVAGDEDPYPAAYVVPTPGTQPTPRALLDHLARNLPAYMVPAALTILEAFPLTPNGKIDRRALPSPQPIGAERTGQPPRNDRERLLADIFAAVLKTPVNDIHTSFFDLGGHSLSATRVVSAIRRECNLTLPLQALFETPTIAALAQKTAELQGDPQTAAPLVPLPRTSPQPLSFAQQRMWFLHRLAPGNVSYNIPFTVHLKGHLDHTAVTTGLHHLISRHEILRTTYAETEGDAHQIIHPQPIQPVLHLRDLRATPNPQQAAATLAADHANHAFDLTADAPIRTTLVQLAEDQHLLLVNMHHIASDGWSIGIFVSEFAQLYQQTLEGRPPQTTPLPVQYADFAVWQRRHLSGPRLERLTAFWRQHLTPPHTPLELPTDFPRPAVQTFNGGTVPFQLDQARTDALNRFAADHNATLFMVLLTTYQILLSRYSGQTQITVGAPIANRNQSEIEPLIGFFVNTLALRADLAPNPSVTQLLAQNKATTLAAYAHQDLPFERLVEDLHPDRDLSRTPLFQAFLVLQNNETTDLTLPRVTMTLLDDDHVMAKFDLEAAFHETPHGLAGAFTYNADLFRQDTIQRLAQHFKTLLNAMIANPAATAAALPLLSPAERTLSLDTWNQTQSNHDRSQTLVSLFQHQVAQDPQKIALTHGQTTLSYRELADRAQRVAQHLHHAGVRPGDLVALCRRRDPDLIAAMLGVLIAGAAYVPLDPTYPKDRLDYCLADSNAVVLITERDLQHLMPATVPHLRLDREDLDPPAQPIPPVHLSPHALSHVIYTSGSTGRPKGVAICHRNVTALIHWMSHTWSRDDLSGVLASTSICFDLSVYEIFGTLSLGGGLILVDNILDLVNTPTNGRVTLLNTVPSAMTELLNLKAVPASVRVVNLAGEPLRGALARDIYAVPTIEKVYNLYGPSEDTTYSTGTLVPRDLDGEPTIGKPLTDTRAYILDPGLQPLPIGVPGELCLAGDGLALGYLGKPHLTAQAFVPNPFGPAGSRLYRTNDKTRYLADGRIQFMGRLDHQVKRRGFRIELGEIEALITAFDQVDAAVVLVREDVPGNPSLVAYLGASPSVNAVELERNLRRRLQSQLPKYMLPDVVLVLPALPLTPNGKIDRKQLPKPRQAGLSSSAAPPRTPEELALSEIFSEVLGRTVNDIHAGFFDLGGHSLLATRIVSAVRRDFEVDLPLQQVFEAPTIAQLAALVHSSRGNTTAVPAVTPVPKTGDIPLSFAQQRMWFLVQLEPGSIAYNLPFTLDLKGRIDSNALEQALRHVVQRHQILRTTYVQKDDVGYQIIHDQPLEPVLTYQDFSRRPEPAQAARAFAADHAAQPFDLINRAPLTAACLQLEPNHHQLLINMHHICSDGWSIGVMMRELADAYQRLCAGAEPDTSAPPIQYADFAVWQRTWLSGEVLERQLTYWRRQLAAPHPVLELPADHPRPSVQTFNGADVPFHLDSTQTTALLQLAHAEGATLFMLLLAAYKTLLFRYTGQPDVIVGSPIANRNRAELEPLIGFFVNTLALRSDLADDPPFRRLLADVRRTTLTAYDHQDLPFERLVEDVHPDRDLARTPLFQAFFALQNNQQPALDLPGLTMAMAEPDTPVAKFELSLNLVETPQGLTGVFNYNTDLFAPATIQRLSRHFKTLLTHITAHPRERLSAIPLLDQNERRLMMETWNQTAAARPRTGAVPDLILARVHEHGDRPALVHGQTRMTYAQLNARANRIAHRLMQMQVSPGTLVAVCCDRTPDLIAALLGVLKTGAAYVPLDPAYPVDRLHYCIQDADAAVLITQSHLLTTMPGGLPQLILDSADLDAAPHHNPDLTLDPGLLSHVIYTSGSTGKPKGVAIRHANVTALIDWMDQTYTPDELDGVLAATSVCFDLSVYEIFGTLALGGNIILVNNVLGLVDLPQPRDVTLINTVPSAMTELLRLDALPASVRVVNLAGEALRGALVHQIYAAGVQKVYNLYGPSEDTTYTTWSLVPRNLEGEPTIGVPLSDTQIYILDQRLQAVPIGVPGELCTAGAGLAPGYLGQGALTAAAFVPNPFGPPGSRLYRTNDKTRYRDNGEIVFMGRLDHQVKLRGFRIELGEIEALLTACGGVETAVVLVREDRPGQPLLTAYVQTREPHEFSVQLQNTLRQTCPKYMIPDAFVCLPKLPLTPNGKIDRKRLPIPERAARATTQTGPRNPTETTLAEIFAQTLNLDRVGVHDNFFDLGGHSLLATRVVSAVRATLAVELPLQAVFQAPTVADLAVRVLAAGETTPQVPPVTPVNHTTPPPLSFGQYRLWFLDQMDPGSPAYNVPAVSKLTGPLNLNAFNQAVTEVIARHSILRTTYTVIAGEPVQRIADPNPITVPVIDLRGREQPMQAAHNLIRRELQTGFDLEHGPVQRCLLYQTDAEVHLVLWNVHHIATDGWSMSLIVNDLTALYDDFAHQRPPQLQAPPLQYADYAVWQHNVLTGDLLENQLNYWRRQLMDAPALLSLPTDHPRPKVQSYKGAVLHFTLPAPLIDQLTRVGRTQNATLFMTLLSAFKIFLFQYAGQQDIVVGTPIAGRRRHELESVVGFFVNTLALRSQLSAQTTFTQLLNQVYQTAMDGFAHQDVPFERVVEALDMTRETDRHPVFQVMFALQNQPPGEGEFSELTLEPVNMDLDIAKFDLSMTVFETPTGAHVALEYNTDLFNAQTLQRMAAHFQNLLTAIAQDPNRPMTAYNQMDPNTFARIKRLGAGPIHTAPTGWVHQAVADRAAERPDHVALVFDNGRTPPPQITYQTLITRVNALAAVLQEHGVGPETVVGVFMPRSMELVIATLAVFKAGGVYLPLDPQHPNERLEMLVEDSHCRLVLHTQQAGAFQAPQRLDLTQLNLDQATPDKLTPPHPDQLAYTIYTSGSTGRPKGVGVSHRAIHDHITTVVQQLALTPEDRCLFFASPNFDVSLEQVLAPLAAGAALLIRDADLYLDPAHKCRELSLTSVNFPTAVFAHWVQADNPISLPPCLRQIIVGGEALQNETRNRWFEHQPGPVRLLNAYGPTETTITATLWEVTPHQPILIGAPLTNRAALILDAHASPVHLNASGELHLSGGLARGYLGRPDLTAAQFIPDPYATTPGARLYKSGDLARLTDTGLFQCLGRLDDQVKIRGFRIELGEVETALNQCPSVRQAVVVIRLDQRNEKQMAAYVVPKQGTPSASQPQAVIRAELEQRLPNYMIPAAWVLMDAFPLSVNGKIDRKSLPAPEWRDSATTYTAPRTTEEHTLAQIFAEVLDLDAVGIFDNFFNIGGHSLLAARAVARINARFQIKFPLADLFENPTVAATATHIQHLLSNGHLATSVPLKPRSGDQPPPLSFAQKRLWFLYQMEPDTTAYNMSFAFRLTGPLDRDRLQTAIATVVRRHDILRTTFATRDGEPVQIIHPPENVQLTLETAPKAETRAWLKQHIDQEALRPYQLETGPLFRAGLIQINPTDHVLTLNMSHLISDGWSMDLFMQELTTLYSDNPTLPPLPIQYADFAAWQSQQLVGDTLETMMRFWREQLEDAPSVPVLQADYPRPAIQTTRGADIFHTLPSATLAQLETLGAAHNATLFMTLLAAFEALLHHYSGAEDLVIGTPVANRPYPEVEPLIGFFVNTLPLRTPVHADETFEQLLARIRKTTLNAFAHQELPFEKMVELLQGDRDPSRPPIFQVLFALQTSGVGGTAAPLGDLTLEPIPTTETHAKFDLSLITLETPSGLLCQFNYNVDLFKPATINTLAQRFQSIVDQLISHPKRPLNRLNLISQAERTQLLETFNNTHTPFDTTRTLVQIMADICRVHAQKNALVSDTLTLTFAQLDHQSERLAVALQDLGVGQGRPAAVCMPRSAAGVVGLLAVLKTGAPYVPLDPDYPLDRKMMMIQDAGAVALLTQAEETQLCRAVTIPKLFLDGRNLPEGQGRLTPTKVLDQHIAYMIYTSGSTGRPKGVPIAHRGLLNFIAHFHRAFNIQASDRIPLMAGPAFDAQVLELWAFITQGATLYIPNEHTRLQPALLAEYMVQHRITVSFLPTALVQGLLHRDWGSDHQPRLLFTGGDKLNVFPLEGSDIQLSNCYGPTEATCVATLHFVPPKTDREPAPSIGRPLANTQIYVVDRALNLTPPGIPGELLIGGVGLSPGYLNLPHLTAQAFIPNPFSQDPGERLYRSGDLVRYRDNGLLEFLGRLDHQVKIRGFRIELGEIESVLTAQPEVADALVLVDTTTGVGPTLVAHVVRQPGTQPDPADLRQRLARSLPDYMTPSAISLLDAFPLTANGKIHRQALPKPQRQDTKSSTALEPATAAEMRLAAIWGRVLHLDHVPVNTSFFEVGGHSLAAVTLMDHIRREFAVDLPLSALFEGPTIQQLAVVIDHRTDRPNHPIVPIRTTGARPPFIWIHPIGGQVLCYQDLAAAVGEDQPFYAVQSPFLFDNAPFETLPSLVAAYADHIRDLFPNTPVALGGWSFGGLIALEIARNLGIDHIQTLVLIDSYLPDDQAPVPTDERALVELFAADLAASANLPFSGFGDVAFDPDHPLEPLLRLGLELGFISPGREAPLHHAWRAFKAHMHLLTEYQPAPWHGPLQLIHADMSALDAPSHLASFQAVAPLTDLTSLPGDHHNLLKAPIDPILIQKTRAALAVTTT